MAMTSELHRLGLLLGDLEPELGQSLFEQGLERFGLTAARKGAYEVVRIAHELAWPKAAFGHLFLEPQVQRIVQVDVGEYGRHNAALRAARRRVHHAAVFFQYACSQPLPDQADEGTVIDALLYHPLQPVVVHVAEEPTNVGLDNPVIPPKLQRLLKVIERVMRPEALPVAIAAIQEVLPVDRRA